MDESAAGYKTETQLILDLLREVREDQKEMNKAISKINSSLVGRDACEGFRKDIYRRIERVESVCTTFEATKGGFIDTNELTEAKICLLEKTALENTELGKRIGVIEDKVRLLDLTWGTVRDNKVILSAFFLWIVSAIGIYSGRVEEFSIQNIALLLVIVSITVVGLWAILNRKRLSSYWPFFL
jgi:hypothetical protein